MEAKEIRTKLVFGTTQPSPFAGNYAGQSLFANDAQFSGPGLVGGSTAEPATLTSISAAATVHAKVYSGYRFLSANLR